MFLYSSNSIRVDVGANDLPCRVHAQPARRIAQVLRSRRDVGICPLTVERPRHSVGRNKYHGALYMTLLCIVVAKRNVLTLRYVISIRHIYFRYNATFCDIVDNTVKQMDLETWM